LIKQTLFNCELRLEKHEFTVVNGMERGTPNFTVKCVRRLVVGTLMNFIDNSIFWVDTKRTSGRRIYVGTSTELDDRPALAKLAAERADVVSSNDEATMASKIQSSLKFLLRLLLDASAGRNATPESALRDLHSGLAPLHNDRLEHSSIDVGSSSAPLLLRERKPEPTAVEAAAINSMLLVAPVDLDAPKLGPGSLYTFSDEAKFSAAFGQEWVKVAEKILNPNKIKSAEQPAIIAQCRPVLVEISADRDYAQRKRPVARLVAGVLVPSTLAKTLEDAEQFRPADYLRHGTDVRLQSPNGDWHPVFISHFVFSLSPAVLPDWIQPIGRLRTGPLAELRQWLAAHATRPGYLSV